MSSAVRRRSRPRRMSRTLQLACGRRPPRRPRRRRWARGAWTVTTTSPTSVRSSSLRSRSLVVLARPEPRQVAREPRQRAALVVGERRRAGVLERGELRALALDAGERLLERAFEGARDEPVLGLAGVELAPRAVGLELGALEREPLPGEARSCWSSSSAIAPAVAATPGRGDGLQERGGDALSSRPPPSDWQALSVPWKMAAAHARIARRSGRRCPNRRPASAVRSARSAPGPAAARRPRARRRRPRRAVSRSRAAARAWRGTRPRTHSRDGARAGRQTTPRAAPRRRDLDVARRRPRRFSWRVRPNTNAPA